MTHSNDIYFGYPQNFPSADEGLREAANVLYALDTLIIGNDDLHQMSGQAISGLSTILNSAQYAIEKAADEIETDNKNYKTGFDKGVQAERENIFASLKEQGIPFKTEKELYDESIQQRIYAAMKHVKPFLQKKEDGPTDQKSVEETPVYPKLDKVPNLSIRDVAVATTWRQGHTFADISQALNLKKTAVERMVERLQSEGVLPQKPDMIQSA